MNYINSIINRKTNEEIIIQKIDKFQRIINSLNDYICLLRTKIQVMTEDLNDIKLLLKYKKIEPKKNKNNYFFESSSSVEMEIDDDADDADDEAEV